VIALGASGKVTDFAAKVGVPVLVAMIALAATIGAAALSFVLSRWADAKAIRREGYAAATRELVAWAEYPYRIRRRTSDDPAALSSLADRGHLHQEALRYRETWILSENRWVGRIFSEVRRDLGAVLGQACNDAWNSEPVSAPGGMMLCDWGPVGVDEYLKRFERAVAFRFGWRRVVGLIGWHRGA
jgi:hypothetical protein